MKACIIGMGAICGNHIEAIQKRNIDIAAVCDIDEKKEKQKLRQYGLDSKVYSDYVKMYDEICPDVVHVCTPHYLHAEMVINALKRNINVLSEKPICIGFEQLNDIYSEYKQSSARYAICFQNRFLPANIMATKLVKDAKVYSAVGNVLWNRDQKYYESGDWRGKWATEGGGALINQAIHTLDLMVRTLGLPNEIKAEMDNKHLKNVIEVEDEMKISAKYDDFEMLFCATTAANDSYPVSIEYATNCGIISTYADKLFVNGVQKECYVQDNKISGKLDWGYGHNALIEQFYNCLQSEKAFECDFENCVDTMLVTFSAYESARTGKSVRVKEKKIL